MHRHSIIARLNSSTGQAKRGLRTLALMACVATLAGCAGTGQKSTAHTSEIDPYEMEWVATADDPIGLLVTQKFKRDRQQAGKGIHSGVNGDNAMVSEALNYLGIRYRFGGSSPDTGFDCSGLVAYSAERSLGLKLPRNRPARRLGRQKRTESRRSGLLQHDGPPLLARGHLPGR